MRVVFDSNIFVSAFAFSGGPAEEAIQHVMEDRVHLVISIFIIHEVLDVLARKFQWSSYELSLYADYLSQLGKIVEPQTRVKIFDDDADNRILECALSGKTDLIVTGDKRMLRLGEYSKIRIVSLKEFLETI